MIGCLSLVFEALTPLARSDVHGSFGPVCLLIATLHAKSGAPNALRVVAVSCAFLVNL